MKHMIIISNSEFSFDNCISLGLKMPNACEKIIKEIDDELPFEETIDFVTWMLLTQVFDYHIFLKLEGFNDEPCFQSKRSTKKYYFLRDLVKRICTMINFSKLVSPKDNIDIYSIVMKSIDKLSSPEFKLCNGVYYTENGNLNEAFVEFKLNEKQLTKKFNQFSNSGSYAYRLFSVMIEEIENIECFSSKSNDD